MEDRDDALRLLFAEIARRTSAVNDALIQSAKAKADPEILSYKTVRVKARVAKTPDFDSEVWRMASQV